MVDYDNGILEWVVLDEESREENAEKDTGSCKRTQTIVGLPLYTAPELLNGESYSLESDLWSLGVCFYEMSCGQMPFNLEQVEDPS